MLSTFRKIGNLLFLMSIFSAFLLFISTSQIGCTSGGSGNATPTPGPDDPTPLPDPTQFPESTPTSAPEDFALDRETLSFVHSIGTTDCPQSVGQIIVTSLYSDSHTFSVSVTGPLNAVPSSFELPSATTQIISVLFTCAQASNFIGSVDVSAEGVTHSVEVTGVVGGGGS